VKIKMKESIVIFYIVFSAITIIGFGSLLSISERGYKPQGNRESVSGYFDGFWIIFQVLTTVGFGDIVVVTYFGRIIVIILSLWSIASQFLSKILYEIIQMDTNQLKSYRMYQIEELKMRCVLTAAKVVKKSMSFNHILNAPLGNKKGDLISTYRDLMSLVAEFKTQRR
jgi:voltage-gated potassium channel